MPDPIRCPDCGAMNEPGAEACAQCNFPLAERRSSDPSAPPIASSPEGGGPAFDPGPRPVPRRRPRPDAMEPVQMQLWLFAGIAVVLGIVYFAAQGFWHSNARPVEGAGPEQQQRADLARQTLEKDSTNLAARIELANVLYDTGNWSEAIVHYKTAARLDPTRSTTVVDLGVCYYNLSAVATAESLFHRAIAMDSHQAVAMFNLGIIAETRQRWDEALAQYRHALEMSPPEAMRRVIEDHVETVRAKLADASQPPRR